MLSVRGIDDMATATMRRTVARSLRMPLHRP